MSIKESSDGWLFGLLFFIAFGVIFLLKYIQDELHRNGLLWIGIFLLSLLSIVGTWILNYKKRLKEKKLNKLKVPDAYTKGVQIVMQFPKKMPVNPYLSNNEKFLRIKFFPKYTESILAVGMIFSFFLPSLSLNLTQFSFYEFVMFDNFTSKLSFIIIFPFLAFILIFLSNYKRSKNSVSFLLGMTPFLFLFILNKEEKKFAIESLLYGFHFSLFLSIFLIILFLYRIFNRRIVLDRRQIVFSSKKIKLWLAWGMFGIFFYLNAYGEIVIENDKGLYWLKFLMPTFALMLLFHYRFNMKLKLLALLTGVTPYITLVLEYILLDTSFLSLFNGGTSMALFFGFILIFFSLRCKFINCTYYL